MKNNCRYGFAKIILFGCISTLLLSCNGRDTARENAETKIQELPVQAQEITIKALGNTMEDIHYSDKEIRVAPGAKVKLTLINESKDPSMLHNIVFADAGTIEVNAGAAAQAGPQKDFIPDTPTVIAASPLAKPGQTVTFEFTAPKAGTYDFFCSYPGHWQKMNGKLIVG